MSSTSPTSGSQRGSLNLGQSTEPSGYEELMERNNKESASEERHWEHEPSPKSGSYQHLAFDEENSVTDYGSTSEGSIKNNLQTPKKVNKFANISLPSTPRPSIQRSSSFSASRNGSESSLTNFRKLKQNYIIPAAKWASSPFTHSRHNSKEPLYQPYIIAYSVFKKIKGAPLIENEADFMTFWQKVIELDASYNKLPENYISNDDFSKLTDSVIQIIENDIRKPERIAQGSSGSYFIYGRDESDSSFCKVGIFKPKDEEPYGPLSPKWTKWLHRTFFPCFFGRSCLIPNSGYLSEVAASVLDKQLLSYIVPHTEIIYLSSSSFYYSYWDRHTNSNGLRRKIGSFQRFLEGYVDAQTWFKLHPAPINLSHIKENSDIVIDIENNDLDSMFEWSKNSVNQFSEELEKLVILDYIMRNTDRGLDNWMISLEWREIAREGRLKKLTPIIKIGAIDSGLAFPWKRPDEWRSFPFGWLFLPLSIIGRPFSIKTRNHYLPLLTSAFWWETTTVKIKSVFQQDSEFKERLWLRQLAVLKGQAFNVVEILKQSHAGPLELTRAENHLVWDDVLHEPTHVNSEYMANAMESSIYDLNFKLVKFNLNTNISTIDESLEPTASESTPLLQDSRTLSGTERSPSIDSDQLNMSGFDYNMSCSDVLPDKDGPETKTRKVIIERLEKIVGKSPFFTWC